MAAFKTFLLIFIGIAQAIHESIFTDVVTDLVKYYGKTVMVTEFSCNKKGIEKKNRDCHVICLKCQRFFRK